MENVQLIVCLGNPGREYAATRHNAGFMAVDLLARRRQAVWSLDGKFEARLARVELSGHKLLLCEPQTYMNSSGLAVGAVAAYYRIARSRLLVVVDDADLPLGDIRMRPGGSSGGHHGLESVETELGSREYGRLRIGIGRQSSGQRQITGHVLGRFSSAESELLDRTLERAADQIECWVTTGIEKAMNAFNGAIPAPTAKENA
ncbi:MAG: aminoacyl-tRNA hydrolase [Pedosphaera parvula]|nr:aminoacyl-tRNA hydrolase [Pedosphaera parvula]